MHVVRKGVEADPFWTEDHPMPITDNRLGGCMLLRDKAKPRFIPSEGT